MPYWLEADSNNAKTPLRYVTVVCFDLKECAARNAATSFSPGRLCTSRSSPGSPIEGSSPAIGCLSMALYPQSVSRSCRYRCTTKGHTSLTPPPSAALVTRIVRTTPCSVTS